MRRWRTGRRTVRQRVVTHDAVVDTWMQTTHIECLETTTSPDIPVSTRKEMT